jgi:hypothetical protein
VHPDQAAELTRLYQEETRKRAKRERAKNGVRRYVEGRREEGRQKPEYGRVGN